MKPVYEVALVGANGFLGTAIWKAFSAVGVECATYDLDRPFLVNDSLEADALEARTIVWAASLINPAVASAHPERVQADRESFARALDAIAATSPEANVVFLSSGGTVYGPPAEPPFTEAGQLHPVNAYGAAKAAMEAMLADSSVGGTAIRIANAYGPGQRPAPGQGVIAHWLVAARDGHPIRVFGELAASRDYVYVDDIARAVVATHTAPDLPAAINVGAGHSTQLGEVLETVLGVVGGSGIEVRHEPARTIDAVHSWLAIEVAKERLGWTPRVTLEEGVRHAWEHLRG